nr:PREDICTED: trichohyalin-like [Bemisia tabaci]
MSVVSMTRSQSLVEQKKLQWAREREELANFYGLWGSQYAAQTSLSKNQFFSSTDLYQRDFGAEHCTPDSPSDSKQEQHSVPKKRSPSLPPIPSKAAARKDMNSIGDQDGNGEDNGEETSGYNSDNGGNEANQESTDLNRLPRSNSLQRRSSVKSLNEGQSEVSARSSWGERMRISQNCMVDIKFPQLTGDGSEVPYWLEKKLDQMSCDSLRGRADGMPAKHVEFRGSTDTICSQDGSTRSFIRGQNVPLTAEELIERERRRQRALEHQNAIKEQLTEKEQKKREEKERKLREEMEEEIRIRKQQEIERKRMEAEEFKRRFKQEQEMRKAEVMQEALRQAERLAKEAKTRLKIKPFHCDTPTAAAMPGPTKTRRTKPKRSHPQPPPRSPRVLEPDPDLDPDLHWSEGPRESQRVPGDSGRVLEESERVAEYESGAESACSLESTAASLSITVKTSRDSQVSVSLSPSRAQGIPSPEQKPRRMVDRATQTDSERDPYHRQCRLPLRYRSQGRPRVQPLNERPKWGVNRPGVRYIKQSEKDPHYQKWRRRRISSETNKSPSTSPTRRIYGCESNAENAISGEKNTIVTRETYGRNQDSSEEGSTYYSRPRIIERDDYGGSATSIRAENQQKNKSNSCSEPCLTSEFRTQSRERGGSSMYSRIPPSTHHREGKERTRRAPGLYRNHSPLSSDGSL